MKYFVYVVLFLALIMAINIGFNHFSSWGTIVFVICIIGIILNTIIKQVKKQKNEKND